MRFLQINNIHGLGSALMGMDSFTDARQYFQLSMNLAERYGYTQNLMESHKELSDLFEEQGQFQNALKHFKNYIDLKDSINNKETKAQIADIESKYQHICPMNYEPP